MQLLIFTYSMMGVLICKYEPFWQEVSAVSDTQVTVKACGPLVFYIIFVLFQEFTDYQNMLASVQKFFFFFRFVWGAHEVCGSHCHFGHQCQHPVHWFWGAFGWRIHQEDPSSDQTKTIGLYRVSPKKNMYIEIKNARNELFLQFYILWNLHFLWGFNVSGFGGDTLTHKFTP